MENQSNKPNAADGQSTEQKESQEQTGQDAKKAALTIEDRPVQAFNQTSILLTRSHSDIKGNSDCSYCHGVRTLHDGSEEKDLKQHKVGFTTTKLKVEDYVTLLENGFTRCGTYVYCRNLILSCCEVYQYKVRVPDFKMSKSQKQTMRRFHRYLLTGSVNVDQSNKDEEQKNSKAGQSVKHPANNEAQIILDKFIQEVTSSHLSSQIEQELADQKVFVTEETRQQHKLSLNRQFACVTSNLLLLLRRQQNSGSEPAAVLTDDVMQSFAGQLESKLNRKVTVAKSFINIAISDKTVLDAISQLSKSQKAPKPQKKPKQPDQKVESSFDPFADPNYYKHYVDQFDCYGDNEVPTQEPKHNYTINISRAVYTQELFDLYKRYESHVHKKDRDKDQLIRFLCSSPLYDPATEPEKAEAPSFYHPNKIDKKWHKHQDEGHYPKSLGTYHFYHRIDGKLVAVGVIDITKSFFNSAYFLYDPDYMFLNLGVMGAIREIEFIRMIRKKHNPDLLWYQLGEMVPNCPKVNYKCNYQPGVVLCPRSKINCNYADVRETMDVYKGLSSEEKKHLPYMQLADIGDAPLPQETYLHMIEPHLHKVQFLYHDRLFHPLASLSQEGLKSLLPFVYQLLKETSLDFLQGVNLELKFRPENDSEPNSSEEESEVDAKKADEKNKSENDKQNEAAAADQEERKE